MVVGMGFCQLAQDPVIFNGAGRDASVAAWRDLSITPWWQRIKKGAFTKRLPEFDGKERRFESATSCLKVVRRRI